MKGKCLAFTLLFGAYSSALGNIGFFGNPGHPTDVLSKSEHVQLSSLEVTILPTLGPNAEADQVMYRCRFVLRNLSPRATTIQVGFPLDGGQHNGGTLDETEQVLLYHFIARDGDKTYHVRYIYQDAPARYRELMLWDMSFSARESRELHVSYILPMSLAVASTVKEGSERIEEAVFEYGRTWYMVLEQCLFAQLTYPADAGKSWKGSIEDATYRIFTAGMQYWMSRRSHVFLAAKDPPKGSSAPQQLYLMKPGLTYLHASSTDWRFDPESGFMISNHHNYKPAAPIRVCWIGTALPPEARYCKPLVHQLIGKSLSAEEVGELSEIVAAYYGITPESDSVRAFVERQVWYHPRRCLRRSDLSEVQRATLKRLEGIAKQHFSARHGGSPKKQQNNQTNKKTSRMQNNSGAESDGR